MVAHLLVIGFYQPPYPNTDFFLLLKVLHFFYDICFITKLHSHMMLFLGSFLSVALALRPVFVETTPAETTLKSTSAISTIDAWRSLIRNAQHSIEWASFYVSFNEQDSQIVPSSTDDLITDIERATRRGVRIRILIDSAIQDQYPLSLQRISAIEGVELAVANRDRGVMHAKYVIVDQRSVYLGSANFDWRALEHISELGLRSDLLPIAESLGQIFERDWAKATEQAERLLMIPASAKIANYDHHFRLLGTPQSDLPSASWYSLSALTEAIDFSETSIDIQLLSYETVDRQGHSWYVLNDALVNASKRGVKIRMLVADWSKGSSKEQALHQLNSQENIEINWSVIPSGSTGKIPYARVAHSKLAIFDRQICWLGTSNWSRDSFENSRNVSVMISGKELPLQAQEYFNQLWNSYSQPIIQSD